MTLADLDALLDNIKVHSHNLLNSAATRVRGITAEIYLRYWQNFRCLRYNLWKLNRYLFMSRGI